MKIGDTGTFKDPRDGQEYSWKVMKDGKKWTTKNHNFKTANAMWYDNKEANGNKYGRLYPQKDLQAACPPGWRVATREEWTTMYMAEGCDAESVKNLMASGNSGFNATLGGYYSDKGEFVELGEANGFWTSTEGGRSRGISTNSKIWVTNMIYDGCETGDETTAVNIRLIAE